MSGSPNPKAGDWECKIKVVLGSDIHAFPAPKTYTELVQKIHNLYGGSVVPGFKLFYQDAEQDNILVDNQEDYQVAINDGPKKVKFTVTIASDVPKKSLMTLACEPPVQSSSADLDGAQNEPFNDLQETMRNPSSSVSWVKTDGAIQTPQDDVIKLDSAAFARLKQEITQDVLAAVIREVTKLCSQPKTPHQVQSLLVALEKPIQSSKAHCCTMCAQQLVYGVIYECPICSDYKVCETCENRVAHSHSLLKIRMRPLEHPASQQLTQHSKSNSTSIPLPMYLPSPSPPPAPTSMLRSKPLTPLYEVQWMSENARVGLSVKPKEEFTIEWQIKNRGLIAWPSDTRCQQIGDIGVPERSEATIVGAVNPEDTVNFSITVKAPDKCGNYNKRFGLFDSQGKKIGSETTVSYVVTKSQAESQVTEQASAAGPSDRTVDLVDVDSKKQEQRGLSREEMLNALEVPPYMRSHMMQLLTLLPDIDPHTIMTTLKAKKNIFKEALRTLNASKPK